jgi:flagellar basal body-associated protein FliL
MPNKSKNKSAKSKSSNSRKKMNISYIFFILLLIVLIIVTAIILAGVLSNKQSSVSTPNVDEESPKSFRGFNAKNGAPWY